MPADRSPLQRRRRWSWVVVGAALLLAFGCGVALQYVRSPEQAALDTAPPARTVLTATVTRQVVTASVITRGTVTASAPVQVPLPAAGDTGRSLVSAAPLAIGADVAAGQVIIAVSGRPVIALHGAIPAYRALHPGDQGDDVTQLQQAIAELGYPVAVDGAFGEQTKAAVRWLYQNVGYQVPSTTGLGEPADPTVTAAQQAVRQGEHQVSDLQRQITAATAAPPSADGQPTGTTDTAGLRSQLTAAQEDLAAARTALSAATAVSGPILPLAEVAFLPVVPARLVALGGPVGAAPTDPVATLDTGTAVVRARVDATQAASLRTGMAAALATDAGDWTGAGTIATIGAAAATDDDPTARADVTITADQPLPGELTGADLKATITEASSDGAALAVPIAAVTASADGSTYVVRVDSSGDQSKVMVTVGVTGDGLVEVTPVDGHLSEGDRVVTGQ
ncbi:MAG TPA: peptidoglycan-binding domain-containing protein [Friedmanniella sp.]